MTAIHEVFGDMRFEATGVHSAGTTTFTLPIEIAGLNRAVRKSDGIDTEIERTGTKTYEATGDYSGDCVLFAAYESSLTTSRFHPRTQEGNAVRFENEMIPQRFTAFVSGESWCFVTMTRLKPSDGTTEIERQNQANSAPDAVGQARSIAVSLDGNGRLVSVKLEANGHYPMTVHGWEVRGILMENQGL